VEYIFILMQAKSIFKNALKNTDQTLFIIVRLYSTTG